MTDAANQESKLFATFEKYEEFSNLQNTLLEDNLENSQICQDSIEEDEKALSILQKLSMILHEYHEQSYLLDPCLESLVTPVANRLKHYARLFAENDRPPNALSKKFARVGNLLYYYMNFRGYKAIVRYFPHEASDLSVALHGMEKFPDEHSDWPLRYVMLIWIYLICMIPFDLSQLDEYGQVGRTASRVEDLAKSHLAKAGLERDGASLLLSRLYMRKDLSYRFPSHLIWTLELLKHGDNAILSIGALQVICRIAKDGSAAVVNTFLPDFLAIASEIDRNTSMQGNTHIRKFKYKLLARIGTRLLPPRSRKIVRGKTLVQTSGNQSIFEADDEQDVPSDIENILEPLLQGLQDKDTIVRWSASKGVARIAERLPTTFAQQVLESIMHLFSIHSSAAAALYDLPAIAESTWHGACLACAEMARRGLVPDKQLPELLDWLSKALYFDLRKGAHSIGSNVRDATAYVLWSLARTQAPNTLEPHAESLARHLVTVSLFDREVHVRRAASAAFQEFVGRTALIPDGIGILGKIDFYAISVRRNAFVEAAPQVAEHQAYRTSLSAHLLNVTLRHWDTTMRELASQSLHSIILSDFEASYNFFMEKIDRLLDSVDTYDLHGALLALAEVARASEMQNFEGEKETLIKDEIFARLSLVKDNILFGHHNNTVLTAALRLIAFTLTAIQITSTSMSPTPRWKKIVEFGLKHRSPDVQEAAAEAMGREFLSSSPAIQQGLGRFLGALRYDVNSSCIENVIDTLLDCVASTNRFNIEARRTCYQALSNIVTTVAPCLKERIPSFRFQPMFRAMLAGLDDYTNDQRGDVGSWIRITCIRGLTSMSVQLLTSPTLASNLVDYLPPELYKSAIAGILKQGLERLDNVRQVAGECFITLLKLPVPSTLQQESWDVPGAGIFRDLLLSEAGSESWGDSKFFFAKAVRFLEVADFRADVLAGIVASMGSKTESIHRQLATSLIAYIENLPIVASQSNAFDVATFIRSLTRYAQANISNNGIVVPVLQTFNALLESNVVRRVWLHSEGLICLQNMFDVVIRNISHIKNIGRVQETMKIVVNLLLIEPMFKRCVLSLRPFLLHRIPRVRMDTAEYLYLKLQSLDCLVDDSADEVETVILETEWMSDDQQLIADAFERLQVLLTTS